MTDQEISRLEKKVDILHEEMKLVRISMNSVSVGFHRLDSAEQRGWIRDLLIGGMSMIAILVAFLG